MADDIKTSGGAVVEGDVHAGGDVTGRDVSTSSTHNKQRQTTLRNDVHFQNADNAVIFQEIIRLSEKIDGLPDRVSSLELARMEVAKTAVTTAQAAAQLAVQTAQAAATLAATKRDNPYTTWVIISLLFFLFCLGLFITIRM